MLTKIATGPYLCCSAVPSVPICERAYLYPQPHQPIGTRLRDQVYGTRLVLKWTGHASAGESTRSISTIVLRIYIFLSSINLKVNSGEFEWR